MVRAEGFRILRLGAVEDAVAGLVSVPDRIIAVNGRHHPRRQRFTLAHELAHVLLLHPPEERCSTAARAVYNREADLCASYLLIPADLLREFAGRGAGPGPLALLFDVSLEALGRRLQEVRLHASLQR
jgi:Zn-dependent peptidase ImmA (M78 family)